MSDNVGSIELRDALEKPELLRGPVVVIPRLAWEGRVTALGSAPKDGKSTLVGQAVAAKVRGETFLGEPTQAGNVVWLALDEPLGDTVARLRDFHARDGVTLFTERPGMVELEEIVTARQAHLIVIDTLTEFVAGIVDDGDKQAQWTPILKAVRGIAQRTNCAVLLLDHTGKSNSGSLLGSTQKAAGVDLIITMAPPRLKKDDDDAPPSNIRHFVSRGRVAATPFSLIWDGERNILGTGELSIETRIYYAIMAQPGISKSELRAKVGGASKSVDRSVDQLVSRGMISDTVSTSKGGTISGHSYTANLPGDKSAGSQGRVRVEELDEKPMSQAESGASQGSRQGTLTAPLKGGVQSQGCVFDPIGDDELERRSIEEEAL
jgi:hypothetical protein